MDNANGREIPLASGASLYVSIAAWREVKALQDAFARAINGSGISAAEVAAVFKLVQFRATAPAADPETTAQAAQEKLSVVAALTRKALELAASKELETAIFACAEKAIYRADGSPETSAQFKLNAPGYGVFDNPITRDKAREDYYAICETIVEENLRPFGKALFSMFEAHVGKSADTQKLNTEPAPAAV